MINTPEGRDAVQPFPSDSAPKKHFQRIESDRFNLAHSEQLHQLFTVPRERRNSLWLEKFQFFAWNASVVAKESTFRGPDGFPYMRLNIPSTDHPGETNCISNICSSLAEQGLGAAFFTSAEDEVTAAQYVISNGVLESLRAYGTWNGDPTDRAELREKPQSSSEDGLETSFIENDRTVLVGDPAPKFLPAHTARFLHWHLSQGWKVAEPRVKLLVDQELAPSRNLVINTKFSDFPDSDIAAARTRMLTWYLPPRRGLILMPEEWTQDQMTPLKEFFQPASA